MSLGETLAANIFMWAASTVCFASGGEISMVSVRAELQEQPMTSNRDLLVPIHGGSAQQNQHNDDWVTSSIKVMRKYCLTP